MAGSQVVLQASTSEGFEVKVTEAQLKGKPAVVTRVGGLPLQVVDGVTGVLVEPGNPEAIAKQVYELLTDEAKLQALGESAKRNVNSEFFTAANARNWLYLALALTTERMPKGNMRRTSHLLLRSCLTKSLQSSPNWRPRGTRLRPASELQQSSTGNSR